ncbi:cytochrome c oxidase subunit Va [Ostertagia ostertagi]
MFYRHTLRPPPKRRPRQTEHFMASQLVRSVARATLSRGNVVRALSTTNALSAKDNVMEKWPAERFDKHFIDYLSRPEIDGWEVRKALTELHDYDVIPDPKVVEAALRACRREYISCIVVTILESSARLRAGFRKRIGRSSMDTLLTRFVFYTVFNVKPVLTELGIPTPEELGYDKPEFFIPQPDYWWEKKWYAEYGYDKKPAFQF